jgi:hypothetical protein
MSETNVDYRCDYKQHFRQHLQDISSELKQVQHRRTSRIERLAAAHWEYVESVLRVHGETDKVIEKCSHHYQTAFVHGWKHAEEDQKNGEELS